MSVDIQNLFNTTLPEAFAEHPDQAKALNVIYLVNITGDGGGTWYIDASETGPKVHQGDLGRAQTTFTLSSENFQKIYEDANAAMKLYFAGELQVAGDPMQAMKLPELMKMCRD